MIEYTQPFSPAALASVYAIVRLDSEARRQREYVHRRVWEGR